MTTYFYYISILFLFLVGCAEANTVADPSPDLQTEEEMQLIILDLDSVYNDYDVTGSFILSIFKMPKSLFIMRIFLTDL
jgi:hypothetical protein